MKWQSTVERVGVTKLPTFESTRILMMPFELRDVGGSLPVEILRWWDVVSVVALMGQLYEGIGYLTIDEQFVGRCQHHRRPGLHVDGWANPVPGTPDYGSGGWGGGGGGGVWGKNGFLVVASDAGSRAWRQEFDGEPGDWGDCEHLRPQLCPQAAITLEGGSVYQLGALTVHETLPARCDQFRQFVRVSMPSFADWPASNTANPLGVQPEGRVVGPRPSAFTEYAP